MLGEKWGFGDSSVFAGQFLDEVLKRRQFTLVDQLEFLDKEDEMFERSVEVRLLGQLYHLLEVLMINVCVYSEQPLQDRFGNGEEILWKWYAWNIHKKYLVIRLLYTN